MNNVITNVDMRTPIEIALDIDREGMTTAKKLYEFLELDPKNYSRWCKVNIIDNEFATEHEDFEVFVINDENPLGGRPTSDYRLTAHFAKKLSLKGNGEKAEQAREYFTSVEERVKQKAIDRTKLSPQMQMLMGMVEVQAKQELEQKRQAERIEKIENTQTAIIDTFQKVDDVENFQKWANSCISKIAQSPYFTKGSTKSMRYSLARSESYDRLMKKRSCRLNDRVQRAKGRALEERPDIKKSELDKINKLYIISNDKDLKTAYELTIKEMMVSYCVKTV